MKIAKEFINRKMTDNTMAKRKDLQNSTHKNKDRVTRTPLQTGMVRKVKQFLLHKWHKLLVVFDDLSIRLCNCFDGVVIFGFLFY